MHIPAYKLIIFLGETYIKTYLFLKKILKKIILIINWDRLLKMYIF